MSRKFAESSTIQAAKEVENKSSLLTTISVAGAAIAPLLLSELGVNGLANDAIINATNGAIKGDAVESILLSTGLIVASRVLEKRKNKRLATKIVIGRINATEIDSKSIPNEYQQN